MNETINLLTRRTNTDKPVKKLFVQYRTEFINKLNTIESTPSGSTLVFLGIN